MILFKSSIFPFTESDNQPFIAKIILSRQTGMLVDESECGGKGANTVASMAHYYLSTTVMVKYMPQSIVTTAVVRTKIRFCATMYALWR